MTLPRDWLEDDIQSLITNGVKESLELDYKLCDSLKNTDGKKAEISKDVSAFANSHGGTLVYGVEENGHIPTGFDTGYDPSDITKEWLEQVINSNIHPRIEGIFINQVELPKHRPGKVLYVVEIPHSTKGNPHQASDKRYYTRFNFVSVPMEDHEIRAQFLYQGDRAKLVQMKRELEEMQNQVDNKYSSSPKFFRLSYLEALIAGITNTLSEHVGLNDDLIAIQRMCAGANEIIREKQQMGIRVLDPMRRADMQSYCSALINDCQRAVRQIDAILNN